MGISNADQSLLASFALSVHTSHTSYSFTKFPCSGVVLQAAAGAVLVFYSSHGFTLFQEGRRLALALFLLFAGLWALVDFMNLLISSTNSGLCQAGLVFSTAFDQLARLGMEQYLVWSIGQGGKLTTGRWVLQGILALRFIAGALFVGFTRPQFAPVCVARTELMPTAIVVLVLDLIIVGFLVIRVFSLGMVDELREARQTTRQVQSKALVLSVVGFSIWSAVGSKKDEDLTTLTFFPDKCSYGTGLIEYITNT